MTAVDPRHVASSGPPPAECDNDAGWICDQVLDLTNGNEGLAEFVDSFFVIFILFFATWLVARLVRRYVGHVIREIVYPDRRVLQNGLTAIGLESSAPDPQEPEHTSVEDARREGRLRSISRVISGTTSAFIWVIGLLLIAGEMGLNIAPLVAGAGLTAAALSFGAQTLIKDLIAGLFVLIEDQYGIGDSIDLGEASGTVEEITLRATVLRGLDGTVWSVPNGEVVRVGNFSKLWSVALVDVDVAYDADLEAAGNTILAAANDLCARDEWAPDIIEEPRLLGVELLGADAITLRLITRVSPGVHWGLQRALRLAIKDALDDAGVEIPFPQRTVWLRTEPS